MVTLQVPLPEIKSPCLRPTDPNHLEKQVLAFGFPVKVAAKKLGVRDEAVRILLRAGRIKGQLIFNTWLIPPSEIKRVAALRRVVATRSRRRFTYWPEVTR
jgi:hypothetical protein